MTDTLVHIDIHNDHLDSYFEKFRNKIIGQNVEFETINGPMRLYYADWTASGRLYKDIEEKLMNDFGPHVGNTHTEVNLTGSVMTLAYSKARDIIKNHVNASEKDILIAAGSGMTGAISKFMRIIGVKLPSVLKGIVSIPEEDRPVVFISHMEHHSNQTQWEEACADVVIIDYNEDGEINLDHLVSLLKEYKNRKHKFASITGCSNVTGVATDYHAVAKIMHQNGGKCFVDFACSAPYVKIDMHPDDPEEKLDAIFFSPHKFLGGPGTTGITVFCESMYNCEIPDDPGGGTVEWTNPWGEHEFFKEAEIREDGGTPPFLQVIKTALAVKLKEEMGIDKIQEREHFICNTVFDRLEQIPNIKILQDNRRDRLAVFSFYIEDCHYNLAVRLLNDNFGVQVRGGCHCAGTYGHYLLGVDKETSKMITDSISNGDLTEKPGWIRMSLHPTSSNNEIEYILNAIESVAQNHKEWGKDYKYDCKSNNFTHQNCIHYEDNLVHKWFD